MVYTIKKNTKVAIVEETTEGTEKAYTSGAAFLAVLADGVSLEPSRDLLDRNILNSSIGRSTPRNGMRSVSVTIPVEAKAHQTAGSAPEYGGLVEGALGATRNLTGAVTSKASGNTTQVLAIEDADISKFAVGDVVKVLESGAHFVAAIQSRVTTGGAATITLSRAAGSTFSNSVQVEKFTTYYPANDGHPSFTVHKSVEATTSQSGRQEKAIGCKVTSMSLSNFSTGQIPEFSFSLEGTDYNFVLGTDGYAATYDTSLPPIALSACLYVDGAQVDVNDFEFTVDNSLGFITSTCSENGKIASRITERQVTGSFNPYKLSDDIDFYTMFEDGTEFELFVYAANPAATAGEKQEVVGFYFPNCLITAYTEGDQDGNLQEQISFSATRGSDGSEAEVYIGFV